MASNFRQPGKVITLTAPAGGVTSGDAVQIGTFLGIASTTASAGERFELNLSGVWEVPKATGQAWAEGEQVYFDVSEGNFTETAAGNVAGASAVEARATTATTGIIRLDGVGTGR